MGISYIPKKIYGVYIDGSKRDLLRFLSENRYNISEEKNEELMDNGNYYDDLMWFLGLGEDWIVCNCINTIAGEDFVIGFETENLQEIEDGNYKERFEKLFPNVKRSPKLIEFVQQL